MISQQTIEEIKTRVDIIEVIGDFVALKKSGQNYKAKSPFTEEKTPSFFVSPSKGIFKCFSTGKGGDAISFLMQLDGLSYVEALKYLAQKYQIPIEEDQPSEEFINAQNERDSLFITLNFAKDYFKNQLLTTDEGKSIGLSYLRERGLSDEVIEVFDLGYSTNAWDGLIQAANKGKYNLDFFEKTGLIIRKDQKQYDRFRGRVTFPIHNITGKVIAFGARVIGKKENQPKYINSPETELYHKSDILYGIAQAKQAIRAEDNCYLVEGYTDVIALYQAGIKNVVASSGTSLTESQVKLIKRYTQNITVLYDGDNAGIKASFRGIDIILEADMNVKAITFPEGDDPDSFSKKMNPSSLKSYFDAEEKDFISFKVGILEEEGGRDPLKRAEAIKSVVESIAKIPDALKRNVHIQNCSKQFNIDEDTLVLELNKIVRKKILDSKSDDSRYESQSAPPIPETDLTAAPSSFEDNISIGLLLSEQECVRVLLNYADSVIVDGEDNSRYLAEFFLSEIEDLDFDNTTYNKIIQLFKQALSQNELLTTKQLMDLNDDEINKCIVDLTMKKHETSALWAEKYNIYIPEEEDILNDLTINNILRLKLHVIKRQIRDNMKMMQSLDEEEAMNELLERHQHLKTMEMEIAKVLGNVLTS